MTITEENATKIRGINIQDAMNILNARSQSGGERLEAPTPELRKLGQTLDLMNTQAWTRGEQATGNTCDCVNDDNSSIKSFLQAENNNDENGESRILRELRKHPTSHIFTILFRLQNERVETYHKFNVGLNQVLLTGNLTQYPDLCTSITASFALISGSIRDIQSILKERSESTDMRHALLNIQQLQSYEKEQLSLTAAMHLEKIREKNESLDGGDEQVRSLLVKGVHDLQRKIGVCVEQINNVLDDLRCLAVEIED